MRDIVLVCIFLGAIPYMIKRPALGIIMWVWLSVMNPHRLTYGFANGLQFAAATAGITLIGLFVTKEKRQLQWSPPVVSLALFTGWICITSIFPFHDGSGYDMLSRVLKIFLMTFVAVAVIHERKQINWLIWIIVFSLGFYGAKGGFFTVITGGSYLVWGPQNSFIEGNNELALALVMTIPLMRYVQIGLVKKWQRLGMSAVMLLTALSALGSHSRGALVAIIAMGGFLWLKSRNKFGMAIVLVAVSFLLVAFMPDEWFARMHTIKTYDEDASAMGRINAWWMAFNLACSRPLGGGFDIYDYEVFGKYAPNPLDVHAAHSIYFQVLGEHGFIGLFLFVSIGVFSWLMASDGKHKAKGLPGFEWVGPLLNMMQVSMIGYGVGGAFLSLAYFDVPYYVMVIIVATRALVLPAHAARLASQRGTGFGRARFGNATIEDPPEPVAPPGRARGFDRQGAGGFVRQPGMAGARET